MVIATIMTMVTSCAMQDAKPVDAAGDAHPAHALVLRKTVELDGVTGRIDHLARSGATLFIAALENDSVEAIDLRSEARTSFRSAGSPAGIVAFSGLDSFEGEDPHTLVAFACGSSGKLVVRDLLRSDPIASIPVGDDADNVRWDEHNRRLWIAYGEGGLARVDEPAVGTKTWIVAARIELGAHPEAFELVEDGKVAWVNLPGTHAIARVDLVAGKVSATIDLGAPRGNYPIVACDDGKTLLVGCRKPPALLRVDAEHARVVEELPLSGDVDDLFVDSKRGRVYACCGAGAVDVFDRAGTSWKRSESIPTADGARTCVFSHGSLYVAAPKRAEHEARILVFDPRP